MNVHVVVERVGVYSGGVADAFFDQFRSFALCFANLFCERKKACSRYYIVGQTDMLPECIPNLKCAKILRGHIENSPLFFPRDGIDAYISGNTQIVVSNEHALKR